LHPNVIEDQAGITEILQNTRRVAVLGMKTEAQDDQPAFYVPKYLVDVGFDVVPVPVYYPEATSILGRAVVRRLADVPPPIDMVNVFRRSKDLAAHVDDILALKPKVVWLQQGIKDAAFAERLAGEGIKVVQDRCLMVELKIRAALLKRK
jgi:predicted CoA-binding protein